MWIRRAALLPARFSQSALSRTFFSCVQTEAGDDTLFLSLIFFVAFFCLN